MKIRFDIRPLRLVACCYQSPYLSRNVEEEEKIMSSQRKRSEELLAIGPRRFQVMTPVQQFFILASLKLMRFLTFKQGLQLIAVVPKSERVAFDSCIARNGLTAKSWH
ncbi:MAG: hypothetical protein Q8N84_02990 [bacterium]|nr:hypothetical protein [bacterium]